MNASLSSYFDDVHRGREKHKDGVSAWGSRALHLQLPYGRADSADSDGGKTWTRNEYWARPPMQSDLREVVEASNGHLSPEVNFEFLKQNLQENARLSRRLQDAQEQLASTSAKKDAFKAQVLRLEAEFKKARDQSEIFQQEVLDTRHDAGQTAKQAQEALQMIAEMQKSYATEIRLLQRGLTARGNGASQNKMAAIADLMDRVGRAVVHRDEALRDQTRMQVQLERASRDSRALASDVVKLRKQNAKLQEQLQDVQRKFRGGPENPAVSMWEPAELEDSDQDFEFDLGTSENRLSILEEGPAGLDILASNLAKQKQILQKRVHQRQETMRLLSKSVEDWKKLSVDKDEQISDMNLQMERMTKDQSLIMEQIAAKRRETEQLVEEEKSVLEAHIKQLQSEVHLTQGHAEGFEKVSSRLTKELVKVHGHYGTSDDSSSQVLEDSRIGTVERLRRKVDHGRKELWAIAE